MTDCAETLQNLHLYLGGELEPTQASTAQRHLALCATCGAALVAAERARGLYWSASVDADTEPLDLWPGIRSRLVSEGRLEAAASPRVADAVRRVRANDANDANNASAVAARADVGSSGSVRTVTMLRRGSGWMWAGLAAAAAVLLLFGLPLLFAERVPAAGTPIATPERPLPTFVRQPLGDSEALAVDAARLRPVLEGEESLIERAWREHLEQEAHGPNTGPNTFRPDQGAYEVVNGRQVR